MQVSSNDFVNGKFQEFNAALQGLKNGKNRPIRRNELNKCIKIIQQLGGVTNQNEKRNAIYDRLKNSINTFEKNTHPEKVRKVNNLLEKLRLFIKEEENPSNSPRNVSNIQIEDLIPIPKELTSIILGNLTPREKYVLTRQETQDKKLLTLINEIKKDKKLLEAEALEDAEAMITIYLSLQIDESFRTFREQDKSKLPLEKMPDLNGNTLQKAEQAREYLKTHVSDSHYLNLNGSGMSVIPYGLAKLLPNITIIGLSDNPQLNDFPEEICAFRQLTVLDLTNTNIKAIPDEIGNLDNLKTLKISHGEIGETTPFRLPETFEKLKNLKELLLINLNISEFPSQLKGLSSLKNLFFVNNKTNAIPEWLGKLKLEIIEIDYDLYKKFYKEINKFENKDKFLPIGKIGQPVLISEDWDPDKDSSDNESDYESDDESKEEI